MDLAAVSAAAGPASAFDTAIIEIAGYANANAHKAVNGRNSTKVSALTGNLYAALSSGWYRSTNAINRITLTPAAGNFAQYSSARLYGVY